MPTSPPGQATQPRDTEAGALTSSLAPSGGAPHSTLAYKFSFPVMYESKIGSPEEYSLRSAQKFNRSTCFLSERDADQNARSDVATSARKSIRRCRYDRNSPR